MLTDSFKLIEGQMYYFTSTGSAAKGEFTVDGDVYYASSDRIVQSGFVSRWASLYYHDEATYKMVKGFATITVDGVKYYAKNGVVQKGDITLWFVTYHLDEETGALID